MTLTELKQISECRGTPLKESLIFKYTSNAKQTVNRLVNNKNHLFDYIKLWNDVESYIKKK